MNIGPMTVTLPVQNLAIATAFYQSLGFEVLSDISCYDYAVLKNDTDVIGLFKGVQKQIPSTILAPWDPQIAPLNIVAVVPEFLN